MPGGPLLTLSLVVDRGIEREMSNHRAAFVNDADVQVRHEDQHTLTTVRPSEADVVQFRAVAQREGPRVSGCTANDA